MAEYKFVFEGAAGTSKKPTVAASPGDSKVPSGNEVPEAQSEAGGAFAKRIVENSIERAAISPLNAATGGLASPVYQLGKTVITGGGAAAIGGGIAGIVMAGVQLAINKINARVARLESEAQSANERDNVLIRAGVKSQATFYEADFFRGVHKTNRN